MKKQYQDEKVQNELLEADLDKLYQQLDEKEIHKQEKEQELVEIRAKVSFAQGFRQKLGLSLQSKVTMKEIQECQQQIQQISQDSEKLKKMITERSSIMKGIHESLRQKLLKAT